MAGSNQDNGRVLVMLVCSAVSCPLTLHLPDHALSMYVS
jgi:hypothetical protein